METNRITLALIVIANHLETRDLGTADCSFGGDTIDIEQKSAER